MSCAANESASVFTRTCLAVEAAPFGLVQYHRRADIRRCDRQPAYLFPRGFDYRRRAFRPISSPPRIPPGAPIIAATPTPPGSLAGAPATAFRSQSASAQYYAAHAGELVPPREVDDLDPTTVWRESTGGHGRGLFITLGSPLEDPEIAAVRLVPGDASSRQQFRRSNRLKRVGLLVGERGFWVEFPRDPAGQGDYRQPHYAVLPAGVRARCVTVVIDQVYSGSAASNRRGGETAISDLSVVTTLDLERGGPELVLVRQVIAGGAAGDSAARLLIERGASAVSIIGREFGRGELSGDAALRLRRVLARIGDPAGAEQLVEGLAQPGLSKGDRRAFSDALVRMGTAAVPPLQGLSGHGAATGQARKAAVQVLAAIPAALARDALIALAGKGDRALRKEVAVGLGARSLTDLAPLQAAAKAAISGPERGREADLWRALGLMARRAKPADQSMVAQAIAARLADGVGYELDYRLLQAASNLPAEPAMAGVTQAIERLRQQDSERARALLRVAASGLAGTARTEARELLVLLVDAADPGVRKLALAGLGPRRDADARTDAAVIGRLTDDPWPGIRRAAASSLGHRCGRAEPARAALLRALDSDAHVEVQRETLSALVSCRADGIGPLLLAVAGGEKRPLKLRQRALTLLPLLADPSLARPLMALFKRLREAAWSQKNAVRLAAGAAVAMGRLGVSEVVPPLLRAAKEQSFPEIQAAAVTGLGEMCPKAALPLFAALIGSEQRAVVVAARAAYNRCRQ